MTILTGAIIWAVAIVVIFLLAIALAVWDEGGALPIVILWIPAFVNWAWGWLLIAFYIFAMFNGHNPLEAFSYEMWD